VREHQGRWKLNDKGACASDEEGQLRGERTPWTATTLDVVCGMKQACEAGGRSKPSRG
jgi:hypothetical protein